MCQFPFVNHNYSLYIDFGNVISDRNLIDSKRLQEQNDKHLIGQEN